MRIVSAFLAILVLFLSVQPMCAASPSSTRVDACCSDNSCEEESSDAPKEKDCKGCNPFQSCACCAMGLIVPLQGITLRTALQAPTGREWSQHLPNFPAAVYGDFWQPPKLA